MPTHTVTTKKGWGKRLTESIGGVLVGLLIFLASFGVLWTNEGRVNKSKLAADTTHISSEEVASEYEGQPVSTTGELTSPDLIGDTYLQPGEYAVVNRNVEMYAWKEVSETTTTTRTGGTEETTTTYDYELEWTSNPADSSNFYDTSYENPTKEIENETVVTSQAKVGVYDISTSEVQFPASKDLTLNEENVIIQQNREDEDFLELTGGYIFKGLGELNDPIVGDVRISYTVVPLNQEVTIFGKLEGSKINPYIGKKNTKLYRMFTEGRDSAISKLQTEFSTALWGFRILGFFLMWIGLSMMLKPLSTFASVLPFLGSLTGAAIGAVTFVVALVLSLVTILIAAIANNIIALVVAVLAILGAVFYILKSKKS